VRLSRSDAKGQCKQLRITRRVDGWYALLVCETPKPEPMPSTGQTVGVDVGITSFATLSNGEEIDNPRHLKSALDKLQRQQRRLSRRQKGSKRRAKQRIKRLKGRRQDTLVRFAVDVVTGKRCRSLFVSTNAKSADL
jgi:putative transposase